MCEPLEPGLARRPRPKAFCLGCGFILGFFFFFCFDFFLFFVRASKMSYFSALSHEIALH